MGYCKKCGVEYGEKKSTHPWIIILVAVLLTGLIFSLPRTVVNKETRELGSEVNKKDSGHESSSSNTGNEITEEAKVDLALTYINGTNPMQGILLLKEVISKNPENERAGFYLGTFSMQTNQFEKAVERFIKVLEINPTNQEAKLYLGISYYKLKEKQKAKDIFLELSKTSKDTQISSAVDVYLKELNNL